MGFFDIFRKKQLLEVIDWEDSTRDTLVYRYQLKDREEIMNSSTLIVRPSQVALFVHKGEIADIFAPGTYKLSTENIPFLTKFLALPTGFNSPIKAEIYFLNTKQFTMNKWGTQNPIMMRDSDFGNIRLRGFGIYAYKIDDAKLFMKEMFGTNNIYTVTDANEYLTPIVVQSMTDAIGESKIKALDLAANYKEFGTRVTEFADSEFKKVGLKITNFIIENLSLPEEVEKALDERTKLGVLEDKMGTYTQMKAANSMEEAAKNTSGNNFAGIGMGLGTGAAIGDLFAKNLKMKNEHPKNEKNDDVKCANCQKSLASDAKFCPDCGAKQVSKFCPKCGEKVEGNSKFCPECGEKL